MKWLCQKWREVVMARGKKGFQCPLLSHGVEYFMDVLEIRILGGLCQQMKDENKIKMWSYVIEVRMERCRAHRFSERQNNAI
ncbi:MAG: hypothetical protein H8D23_06520 [Candidatus Brocadiales bacterium]|nr:hypothetical protein [Candidatus Brocadiales bacterium]